MKVNKYVLSAAIALSGLAMISNAEGKPLQERHVKHHKQDKKRDKHVRTSKSTASRQTWDPSYSQGWQLAELETANQKTRHRSQYRYSGVSYASAGITEPIPQNSGVGPRPGQWCGWWMRTQKGGGPDLNVAWNWRNYGVPTAPQVGAIVVWRHHVGMLVGQNANGMWLVKSGNDGGAVRTRPRSIEGAIFRI